MKISRSQLLTGLVFLALVTLAGIGYLATSQLPTLSSKGTGRTPRVLRQVALERMEYETAGQLAAMTDTDGEQQLATQAVHLSDQVLDRSLQEATETAEQDMRSSGTDGRALLTRLRDGEEALDRDKSAQAQLEAEIRKAPPAKAATLREQLAMTTARIGLEEAQLTDARSDAMRSDSTDLGLLEQIAREHQANHSSTGTNVARPGSHPLAPGITIPVRGLADALGTIYRLHQKQGAIEAAQNQTSLATRRLLQQHTDLDNQLQREEQQKAQNAAQIAAQLNSARKTDRQQGRLLAGENIDLMHRLADEQKRLSGYDDQIQLEQELADIYNRWQMVTVRQQKQILHSLFRDLLLLMLMLAALVVLDGLVEHVLQHLHREPKRLMTLRRLTRLGFTMIGAVGILLMTFGRPEQLVTLLGLAGAGLTVAFEDALLSLAGWFVLVGRNGLAIGDWVEINGVTGEVIEVRLFRTVLLETGNWTEPGHPTGRKVFCPNAFAFRSAYFNFTTAKQWLWDEIQVTLPPDLDPRRVTQDLAEVATRETGDDAEAAARDHQRSNRLRTLHAVPTAPLVQLRPGASGLLVCVRYVTTAQKRAEMRARLYQAILSGMEHERSSVAGAALPGD